MKEKLYNHKKIAIVAGVIAAIAVVAGFVRCTNHKFDRVEYQKSKMWNLTSGRGDRVSVFEIEGTGTCQASRPQRAKPENAEKSEERAQFMKDNRFASFYSVSNKLFYDDESKQYIGTKRIEDILKNNGVQSTILVADGYVRIAPTNMEDATKVKVLMKTDPSLEDYDIELSDADDWRGAIMPAFAEARSARFEEKLYGECEVEALKAARTSAKAQASALGVRLRGIVSRDDDASRRRLKITLKYAVE